MSNKILFCSVYTVDQLSMLISIYENEILTGSVQLIFHFLV